MRIKVQDSFDWGTELSKIEVPEGLKLKISSGLDYFDGALGGSGFTPSCVTLFTGEAGAGKTTITLTLADSLAKKGNIVVFNTAEESLLQVKMTAQRLGLAGRFRVGGETHVPTLLKNCDKLREANPGKPFFLFVDSLQCMDDGTLPGRPDQLQVCGTCSGHVHGLGRRPTTPIRSSSDRSPRADSSRVPTP